MRFVVRSRWDMMAALPPEEKWAVISICEKADYPQIQVNEHLVCRLNLQFHDVDVFAYEKDGEEIILFNDDHARQILNFLNMATGLGAEVIYVHCLMGQCRSAAVAAALEKALTGDDSKYFGNGPYRPNMRVYRGVLNECHERGMI